MTSVPKKFNTKPQKPLISENKSRSSIEEQTAAFLKRGGEVQQIPTGRTGYTAAIGRNISLSKKITTAKG